MTRTPLRHFGASVVAITALTIGLVGVAAPAAQAGTNTSCTSMSLAAAQSRILDEVNAARAKAGVPALQSYSALTNVAVSWSKTQAARSTMSHNPYYAQQIPSGWTAAGENVAYGYSPTAVTDAWMDSTGHRENIQRRGFTHIGIGMACSSTGRPFYTQVFGGYKTLKSTTPRVAGTPKVGQTLTALRGTWTADTQFSYRWYASGSLISGANGRTYVPKASDVGKTIKVRVTGKKLGYTTVAKASVATARVAKASTLSTVRPRISGTVKVGSKLTAIRGTWTSGTTYTYRWYADGRSIWGATGKSYTPTSSVRGKTLKVKVTGKKAGYTTATRTSVATRSIR